MDAAKKFNVLTALGEESPVKVRRGGKVVEIARKDVVVGDVVIIEVGDNFYVNHNCVILDGAKVTFGDNVFIAPNCGFYTAGHPIDYEQRNQGLEYAYPITVGSNVWIGGNCVILPGVTIGDNCVIGAGSVVNRDIPSGSIAVGNPCRVLRKITEADRQKYRTSPMSDTERNN